MVRILRSARDTAAAAQGLARRPGFFTVIMSCRPPQQPREATGPPAGTNSHLPDAGQRPVRRRRADRAGKCVDRQRLQADAFDRRDLLRANEQHDVRPGRGQRSSQQDAPSEPQLLVVDDEQTPSTQPLAPVGQHTRGDGDESMEPRRAGKVVDRGPLTRPCRSPQRGHVRPRPAPSLEELADRGDRTPFDRVDGADLEREIAIAAVAVAPSGRVAASGVRHDNRSTGRIPYRARRPGSLRQTACAQHGRRAARVPLPTAPPAHAIRRRNATLRIAAIRRPSHSRSAARSPDDEASAERRIEVPTAAARFDRLRM